MRKPRQLSQFDLDGRIVVRDGLSRHYGNLSWRHDVQRDEILLTTPLGQGVAELTRDAKGARLVMADRREFFADDFEGLSERIFGSRLPLDDLPRWLSGESPPVASGWRVEYVEYESAAADALPTLIQARRGDIELRLKITDWGAAR